MLFEDHDNSTQIAAQMLRCISRSGPAPTRAGTLRILLVKQPVGSLQGGWTE